MVSVNSLRVSGVAIFSEILVKIHLIYIGSHDITNNRDMRDALGALGPVDGNKPELSNLTLSMTIVDKNDIVYLTSDGVSDNFDPVVGKFAEAEAEPLVSSVQEIPKIELAPKRQNKSASSLYSKRTQPSPSASRGNLSSVSFTTSDIPVRPPRNKKSITSASISNPIPMSDPSVPVRPKYGRSKTLIEQRPASKSSPQIRIKKSAAGLPIVSATQRHALTLLRMEDLFCYGINGTLRPCTSAKRLCNLLIDFTKMISSGNY